ncbi:MAG: hypothetical protein O2949_07260 [Proteobacteria bacterium]|nr:hypothetical protein [Pseudomonadota bacterium]
MQSVAQPGSVEKTVPRVKAENFELEAFGLKAFELEAFGLEAFG